MRIGITGASGFIGRNMIERLVENGHQITALGSKKPDLPQFEAVSWITGRLEESRALEKLCTESETLIHLVGIIVETKEKSFERTVVEGTRRLVEAAKQCGVARFIYMSAIGADRGGSTAYFRTKAAAESTVAKSGIDYTIFRPSLVYGKGDGFLGLQKKILKLSPLAPIAGSGRHLMQPVFVGDLCEAIARSLKIDEAKNRVIEIGGPDRLEYRRIIDIIKKALGIKRPNLYIPIWFMKLNARLLSLFLSPPPFTADQMTMLEQGSIADIRFMKEKLGVTPIEFEEGLARSLN